MSFISDFAVPVSSFRRSDAQRVFGHGNLIFSNSIAIAAIQQIVVGFTECFVFFFGKMIAKDLAEIFIWCVL